MKNIKKIIKILIVGSIWTYIFVALVDPLFQHWWRFSLLRGDDWQTIAYYWNHGGKFKTANDFALLGAIAALPIVWVVGLIWAYKIKYTELLLKPLEWMFDRKYLADSGKRIVIKNIGLQEEKESEADIIKKELKNIEKEIDNSKETAKIRENIAGQINQLKK